MARRKFDDIQLSKKYRCCFGYLHVKTATQILCAVLVVNSGLEIKNFILEEKYEVFEIIKILYGISSAFGPVIGIERENPKYFFPFFFGPVYSLILILLYVICPSKFGRRMDEVLNKFNSKSREVLFKNLAIFSIFIFFIALFFIFQIWIYSVLYKCYKYISAISLQIKLSEFQAKQEQALALKKLQKRRGNYYLQKSNGTKKLVINTTPTLVQRIKKNIECLFGKLSFIKYFQKKILSEAKEQNPRTIAAKSVEDKSASFKPKTPEPKPSQEQKLSPTITEKTKPIKCELNVQLKNPTLQSESVKFTVKLKSTEVAEKVLKLPRPENRNLFNSIPFESFLQREAEFHANQEQNPLILTTASKFEYYNLHNYPDKSNPKNLVSSEVQTDETSFDQTINKNNQYQNNEDFEDCSDSDTYSNNSPKEYSFSPNSISDTANFFSMSQTSNPSTQSYTKITFLFKNDETCAVEIYQNGMKNLLKNSFDNEWTPLYFSMARSKFEIGEKAQIHYHQFPEYVLYDIFKIIGKSMNEINYNPEWLFKVVRQNGIKYFQIKTPDGSRLYPEDSIIAAFLKSLKVQAENYLNTEIHEIYLSTNFELTDSQKNVFKNAASKIYLKILSFSVTEI